MERLEEFVRYKAADGCTMAMLSNGDYRGYVYIINLDTNEIETYWLEECVPFLDLLIDGSIQELLYVDQTTLESILNEPDYIELMTKKTYVMLSQYERKNRR